MKNILDYVKEESSTFNKKAFNDVDSLVLSQLAYVDFNDKVQGTAKFTESIHIWQLLEAENFHKMLEDVLYKEESKELLLAISSSPRFRDIRLCYYEDITDTLLEKQFSSITYLLPFNTAYIAFRGTDNTLVGWKEDFNMAFMNSIPAQQAAAEQINKVGKLLKDISLMVGGHSKGGNLAIYGAAKCKEQIQQRITAIYSHDGPGFRDEFMSSEGFKMVADKVRKTVPEFSVIGMLLQNQDNYRVVKSSEEFLMQHNPFSWEIGIGDFVYIDNISDNALRLDESISKWLEKVDDKSRERFIDALFSILKSVGVYRIRDLQEFHFSDLPDIFSTVKGIDGETKQMLKDTIKQLTYIAIRQLTEKSKLKELFNKNFN